MKSDGLLLYPEREDMEKLLEMGKELYPEYNDRAKNVWEWYHTPNFDAVCIYKDSGTLYIHWFEFLIKWVTLKLEINYKDYFVMKVLKSKDPVQIVYDRFKDRKIA